MQYISKKTTELTTDEKLQICTLFNEVFLKNIQIEDFDTKFLKNPYGYSFHGFMVTNGKIVGCYSTIPYQYSFFGTDKTFGLSVDTMIAKDYRGDKTSLLTMSQMVYDLLLQDNIPFVFGFPNDNAYWVRKKRLLWSDIGTLNFYILPLRVSKLLGKTYLPDVISRCYAYVVNLLAAKLYKKDFLQDNFNIKKISNDFFLKNRFPTYKYDINTIQDSVYYISKIEVEDGVRTLYIIDISILTKNTLRASVKHAYDKYKNTIDIVIYVGRLEQTPINLIKLPQKFHPKQVYMSGKILDDTQIDKRVFNIKNWNVNLSSYDVR